MKTCNRVNHNLILTTMKNRFFKPGLQIAAILIAAFGAFAFSQAPAKDASLAIVFGRMPVSCADTNIECTTDQIGPLCKSGVTTLYEWDGSGCAQPLHKKPQ